MVDMILLKEKINRKDKNPDSIFKEKGKEGKNKYQFKLYFERLHYSCP